MKERIRQCFHLIQEIISENPEEFNSMTVEDFSFYLLDEINKKDWVMAQFISLRTQGRCGEIMVNVDEISSCHIEGGFSYTDYILILKNGTRYNLNVESYTKVMNLISE